MADQQALQLNEDAVRALAEKLAGFMTTLEPAEATALADLLRRAAVGDDDVAGYAWWDLKSGSGWFNYLTSAMLAVVVSEGMIIDQHVLEHFYGPIARSTDDEERITVGGLAPAPAS